MRATKPTAGELEHFSNTLLNTGLNSSEPKATARAILESVSGVRVERSGVQPASPLSPSIALAQNMPGLQGAAKPPDVAGILETMFSMGTSPNLRAHSASRLWRQAAERRLEIDPLLRRIDSAFDTAVLDNPRRDRPSPKSAVVESSLPYFGEMTPFGWFSRSWRRLTSPEWVDALPSRVWVDWATTVTRMAFGMGYLWESAWYEAIAREALTPSGIPDVEGRIAQRPLVPWRPETNGVSIRDVAATLKWRVHRGIRIRSIIADGFDSLTGGIDSQVLSLRQDERLISDLAEALQSTAPTGSGTNAWEAVRYALRTRESATDAADYYGFLTSFSRYLVPAPGTEWIAVIASLAAGSPGGRTEVATLTMELRSLGLRPDLGTLIRLLERSGLARGSADADQGVVVQSAF